MANYVLLLERTAYGLQYKIRASCAVLGEPDRYYGVSKTFDNLEQLNLEFSKVGVAHFEVNEAVGNLAARMRSFAPISFHHAQSLELLAELAELA